MRPLALLAVAALAACGGYPACPTGVPLQRQDLPCTCGEEAVQGASDCASVSCDGTNVSVTGECADDTGGDSGDTADTADASDSS